MVPVQANGAGAGGASGIGEAEEQTARGRVDGDAVGAVGGVDGVAARRPVCRGGEVCVLLQGVAAGVRPGDDDAVAGARLLTSFSSQTAQPPWQMQ